MHHSYDSYKFANTGWAKKTRRLHLTANVFKMPETICMLFCFEHVC